MALHEFKVIYWFEFGHRMLARSLGLVFALPLAWFFWRGYIGRRLRWPLLGGLGLGILQGWMGWFMVSSGLVDVPRVRSEERRVGGAWRGGGVGARAR